MGFVVVTVLAEVLDASVADEVEVELGVVEALPDPVVTESDVTGPELVTFSVAPSVSPCDPELSPQLVVTSNSPNTVVILAD